MKTIRTLAVGLAVAAVAAIGLGPLAVGAETPPPLPGATSAASDALADDIQSHVERGVAAARAAQAKAQAGAAKLDAFRHLVRTGNWTEVWPDQEGKPQARQVTGEVWTAAIQAALDQHHTVTIPARPQPYYLDAPLVLKSGQSLVADAQAEIRLQPGVNTCLVRNEHIVGAQNGPVPADAEPDRNIVIEGGIWTTLATSRDQWNGNSRGRSAKQGDVPGCHGVVLLSNVCGAVVQKLTVRQSRAFGVHLSNCRDFLVQDVRFEDHGRDGVHVNGPTAYGVIRHVRGVTHDDFVALNAWEWMGYTPTFGPIQHVLVEDVSGTDRASGDYASPYPDGTAEIRLLPGTKVFAGGTRLACDIGDCVFRNLVNIRTVKMYDQPNLELGRDKDFADPIGTIRNVYFSRLMFERPGRFQIAANVDSLTIDDVQFRFVPPDDVQAGGDRPDVRHVQAQTGRPGNLDGDFLPGPRRDRARIPSDRRPRAAGRPTGAVSRGRHPPGASGRPAAESRLPEDHPSRRFGQGPDRALATAA